MAHARQIKRFLISNIAHHIKCAARRWGSAMSVLSEEEALRRSRAPSVISIRNLNCWGCGVKDVSVLETAQNLKVLNLRYSRSYLSYCHFVNHALILCAAATN